MRSEVMISTQVAQASFTEEGTSEQRSKYLSEGVNRYLEEKRFQAEEIASAKVLGQHQAHMMEEQ